MDPVIPHLKPYGEPLDATVEDGAVVIFGPDLELDMTPEAAAESAERIRRAAEEAMRAGSPR